MRFKKILFPTDFSENANNALRYATEIASAFNSDIILLHTYKIPTPPFLKYGDASNEISEQENEIRNGIAAAEKVIYSINKNLLVSSAVKSGDPTDVLLAIIPEINADLIVMGTKGASGIKEILIGTYTVEVMSNAPIPVLAIPERAYYKPIHTITFATELKSQQNQLKELLHFASIFNADITVLNLSSDIENEEQYKGLSTYNNEKPKFVWNLPRKGDKERTIRSYLAQYPTDVLALVRKSHPFPQSLFEEDYVKEFTYHSHIPILILPGHD
ncbi:MAG: universal stress protein [Cytophagaceae bacterium]